MKNLLIITMLLGVGYSQCNESNWEDYYPDMAGCYLSEANLSTAELYQANLTGAHFSYTHLDGACLEDVIGFTPDHYSGTPIFCDCGENWEDSAACSPGDANTDGVMNVLDVVALVNCSLEAATEEYCCPLCYMDMNGDASVNVLDVVILVNYILNP